MSILRSSTVCIRSCLSKQIYSLGAINLLNNTNNNYILASHDRHISSTIESIVKTQSGFFQSISESTPVEYLQNFLVYAHDHSGLPWWVTIICTTILLRSCVTVPFAIYQQSILARVENISAELPAIAEELKKEMHVAVLHFKWDETTAQYHYRRSIKKQWNNLIVRDNCHPFKASILLFFQIPMWVCFSVSLRNLVYELPITDLSSHLIFTELSLGGFGWIPNLTVADSSLILPVALGLINLTIIEVQNLSKVKEPSKLRRYITNFFRLISIGMIPIAASVPSCLVLYWTTSCTFGLVQNLVLMSPKVKRFCRVPQTKSELQHPYEHLMAAFKNKLSIIPGVTRKP